MKNYLRAYCEVDQTRAGKAGEPIRFIASTSGVKRDGLDLEPERWYLDNYRRNPVVLWAHDYFGRNLPIGRATAEISNEQLLADVLFDMEDDFARQVDSKYRRGFLNAVSVGWDIVEKDQLKRYDLLDISAVPVPGDPDALMEREFRALKTIFEETDPPGSGEVGWERTAARMAALFTLLADDPDQKRETTYKALLPAYRRSGKTPPDFQTVEELRKLTPELIRGLFLANEPELFPEWFRSEPKLSFRTHAVLQRAVDMIESVLIDEPDPEDPQPEPPPDELEKILNRLNDIGENHENH